MPPSIDYHQIATALTHLHTATKNLPDKGGKGGWSGSPPDKEGSPDRSPPDKGGLGGFPKRKTEPAKHPPPDPARLQQLLAEWTGISPQHFDHLNHARRLLAGQIPPDHPTKSPSPPPLKITPLDPDTNPKIHHQFTNTPFGPILLAATPHGLCRLTFADNKQQALAELKQAFPQAHHTQAPSPHHQAALNALTQNLTPNQNPPPPIPLTLTPTLFQQKVWQALAKIPPGTLTTYATLAQQIGTPKAARAVGQALKINPIAVLIPCHRVIQANGKIENYAWGTPRKLALLLWEAAHQKRPPPN